MNRPLTADEAFVADCPASHPLLAAHDRLHRNLVVAALTLAHVLPLLSGRQSSTKREAAHSGVAAALAMLTQARVTLDAFVAATDVDPALRAAMLRADGSFPDSTH